MKGFRLTLVGLILVCLLLAVGVQAAPEKLVYWTIFTGPDGQTMQSLVDRFNAEHKGKIEVEMSVMPAGNFYEKIISAVVGNQAPDVCIMHVDRLTEFTSRGILLPLDEYLNTLGLKGSDYAEPLWNGGLWQGKRYAIPLDTHPLVMYWNKQTAYGRRKFYQSLSGFNERQKRGRQDRPVGDDALRWMAEFLLLVLDFLSEWRNLI